MKIETTFGERLRQIRQHLKYKQADFAEKLNISGPALSEIENDKYKPGHDFFYNLVQEFNVNLYYLLFGEGDMFSESTSSFSPGLAKFAVVNEEVSKFLWYFEHSPIVQYYILGQFRRFYQKEKEEVELDIESYKLE
jgi:transcriptional regulator with XRE-family HTH domain